VAPRQDGWFFLSPWRSFRRRHLFDYPASALRLWLLIVVAGLSSFIIVVLKLFEHSLHDLGMTLIAVGLSAAASRYALQVPRTKSAVSAADVFILGALVQVGPVAAVLAAGVEGWIGTRRTSRRLSSWVASPAAAMAAMAVCAWTFLFVRDALVSSGLTAGAAALCALVSVALLPYLGTMLPLLSMMALKGGTPLRPLQWLASTSWMAAMYVGAAFVAGLVHLASLQFGTTVLTVSVVAVFGIILLLRITFERQETERREQEARVVEAEQEAEMSQKRFTAAFTHAAIGMAVVRPDDTVLQVNPALCGLLGVDADTVLRRRFCDALHPDDAVQFRHRVQEALAPPTQAFSMLLRLNSASGELHVSLHCSPYDDPQGIGSCLIYQLQDITSRLMAERRLHHIAHYDTLTGLSNRHSFHERLALAVERTRLDSGERFAVLFMDLDRFKLVNDSFGHHVGNELLVAISQRLSEVTQPDNLVARLGGDEFAVLLERLDAGDACMRQAQALLDAVSRPVEIQGTEVLPGASVGITFSDLGYRTVDEILRDADLAMYEAKAEGGARVVVFDHSMHERAAQRLALENDLRAAIGSSQMTLAYQPIFDLEPQRLTGFEALLRWTHPLRGAVSPAMFVALAEETGQIEALTKWVVETTAEQLARWQRDDPGISISVNISGRDLVRPGFAAQLGAVLARHAVSPGSLLLEITETSLMNRLDAAVDAMRTLRADGFRFSIDDFGTGYSSLAYLSQLPIDTLKIDRAFVSALGKGPENLAIVRTIQQLGRVLQRRVVAEGIETDEQLATLREMGVDAGQGYLLARPMPAEQATSLIALERSEPP
jgi:diguanylate cyclase (GGDEF)-like protein/PAS domain S-box-containing protein